MFWCSPPRGKCEWVHCKGFVEQYNAAYGKAYSRSKCLDVEAKSVVGQDTPAEPELLLKAVGEPDMVVERKSVVWPPDHLSDHSNEHELFECIVDLLGDEFSDSLYKLTIREESLTGKKKREIKEIANRIADGVLANAGAAKSEHGIRSAEPMPWRFRALSFYERDDNMPDSGVGVVVESGWDWSDLSEISAKRDVAKAGYSEELDRLAKDAEKKFAKYTHCLKILLVEFYGDESSWIGDDDVIGIIQSAQLPKLIDQVWVAGQEWVSEGEYQIVWERAR